MSSAPKLSDNESAALGEFVRRARALLGSQLKEARLFGSRARGEGHEESDLDIALIVTAKARARRHELYDLAYDIGLEHGVELAPVVFDEQRFLHLRARERIIVRDIESEGIPL